jgi:hypothetical protein
MKEFMNNLYGAIGAQVTGYHNRTAFHGHIVSTRAKYGDDISVTVMDGDEMYIISGKALHDGGDGVNYTNLHVYF